MYNKVFYLGVLSLIVLTTTAGVSAVKGVPSAAGRNPPGRWGLFLACRTPSPAGDLIFFFLNLLGSRLPNLLTGLGDRLPNLGVLGVWESTLQLLGVD
jgi:hypothetical protein